MPLDEINPLFFMLIEPDSAGILLPPLLDAVPKDPEISELAKKLVVAYLSVEPPSLELDPCTIACC